MGWLGPCVVVVLSWALGAILYSGPFDNTLCRFTFRRVGCDVVHLDGYVSPGYHKVLEAFKDQFETGYSAGAQLSLWKDGKEVVRLHGSYGQPNYNEDSLQIIFSSTKAVVPLVIGKLMEMGLLDLDDPIAKHWPNFGKHGKEEITITQLLRHESGLDGFNKSISWETFINQDNDLLPMHKLIEESDPFWHPISRRSYHLITIGFVVNELVKRVDPKRRNIGQFVLQEFAEPLGIDLYIGLPDEVFPRFHYNKEWPRYFSAFHLLIPYYTGTLKDKGMSKFIDSMTRKNITEIRSIQNPLLLPDDFVGGIVEVASRKDALQTISPASNGVSNAKSLAKLFGMVANGGQLDGITLLKRETIHRLARISADATKEDAFLGLQTTFSDGGWAYNLRRNLFYGWGGMGGSIALVSPERNAALVYTMNGMAPGLGLHDPRSQKIMAALPEDF